MNMKAIWKRAATLGLSGMAGVACMASESAQAQQYGRYSGPVRQVETHRVRRVIVDQAPPLVPPSVPGQSDRYRDNSYDDNRYDQAPIQNYDPTPLPLPAPRQVPLNPPPVVDLGPAIGGYPQPQAPTCSPKFATGNAGLFRLVDQCAEEFDDLADEIEDNLCSPYKGRLVDHAHSLEDLCTDMRRALRRNADPVELDRCFARLDQSWTVLKTHLLRHRPLTPCIARTINNADRLNAEIQQVLAASQLPPADPAIIALACQAADQAKVLEQLIETENRCNILVRDVHALAHATQALHFETQRTACPQRLGAILATVQHEARQVESGLERTRSGFGVFRAWQGFDATLDGFAQQFASNAAPVPVRVAAPLLPPAPRGGAITNVNLGFRVRIR